MKTKIVFVLLIGFSLFGLATVHANPSQHSTSSPSVRPADQGCSLWGNPGQPTCGGGGSGGTGVHGVVLM